MMDLTILTMSQDEEWLGQIWAQARSVGRPRVVSTRSMAEACDLLGCSGARLIALDCSAGAEFHGGVGSTPLGRFDPRTSSDRAGDRPDLPGRSRCDALSDGSRRVHQHPGSCGRDCDSHVPPARDGSDWRPRGSGPDPAGAPSRPERPIRCGWRPRAPELTLQVPCSSSLKAASGGREAAERPLAHQQRSPGGLPSSPLELSEKRGTEQPRHERGAASG